jgi:hypothetical protein
MDLNFMQEGNKKIAEYILPSAKEALYAKQFRDF